VARSLREALAALPDASPQGPVSEWLKCGHHKSLDDSYGGCVLCHYKAEEGERIAAASLVSEARANIVQVVPDTFVAFPKNADQAELMMKLGMQWLEQNAPNRLRSTQPAVSEGLNRVQQLEQLANDFAAEYEFDDGDDGLHVPNDGEREMLFDFAAGMVGAIIESRLLRAPQQQAKAVAVATVPNSLHGIRWTGAPFAAESSLYAAPPPASEAIALITQMANDRIDSPGFVRRYALWVAQACEFLSRKDQR
jgi:hypothetical protein